MGSLRIVSKSGEPFKDREEAGRLLAQELSKYWGKGAVVLGIPRGGVVIGKEIAAFLKADLDILLAHKLTAPGQPELAMGSVSEDGKLFLNERVISGLYISPAEIEEEKKRQIAEIKRRVRQFRSVRQKVSLSGRIVIITDDGVATGSTAEAAVWAARGDRPEKLIMAMPVGPEDTIKRLAEDVDEMLCLRVPPFFGAVGQFYENFKPVEDYEVIEILKNGRNKQ